MIEFAEIVIEFIDHLKRHGIKRIWAIQRQPIRFTALFNDNVPITVCHVLLPYLPHVIITRRYASML
jgi:hypothetical protein